MAQTLINITSADTRIDCWPYAFSDYATTNHTIWDDSVISIFWSWNSNWWFFNAKFSGSYIHHTRRFGASGGSQTTFNNSGTFVAPTNGTYFSNDGTVPGTSYSLVNPNTSLIHFKFTKASDSQVLNYTIDTFSARTGGLPAAAVGMSGTVRRILGETVLPAE